MQTPKLTRTDKRTIIKLINTLKPAFTTVDKEIPSYFDSFCNLSKQTNNIGGITVLLLQSLVKLYSFPLIDWDEESIKDIVPLQNKIKKALKISKNDSEEFGMIIAELQESYGYVSFVTKSYDGLTMSLQDHKEPDVEVLQEATNDMLTMLGFSSLHLDLVSIYSSAEFMKENKVAIKKCKLKLKEFNQASSSVDKKAFF